MSSRWAIFSCALLPSALATVRQRNDSSTGSSTLAISPLCTAMPASVPTTALVTELTRWRMPGRNGA